MNEGKAASPFRALNNPSLGGHANPTPVDGTATIHEMADPNMTPQLTVPTVPPNKDCPCWLRIAAVQWLVAIMCGSLLTIGIVMSAYLFEAQHHEHLESYQKAAIMMCAMHTGKATWIPLIIISGVLLSIARSKMTTHGRHDDPTVNNI